MDDELERRFAALREEEANQADDYATFLAREPARREERSAVWSWPIAVPAAGLAAVLLLLWSGFDRAPAPPAATPVFEPGRWAMPTDVLLEAGNADLWNAPLPFDGFDGIGGFAPEAEAPTPWRNSG